MKKSDSILAVAPTLDDLVIGSDELEDADLAAALHGRVGLVKERLSVRLLGAAANDGAKKRLIAAGLARHAMRRKGWLDEGDLSAAVEWFANQIQQKPKSVTEELSRLKKLGLMDRDQRGWHVPTWALRQAIVFLGE
ncbi:MAG: hypothetical protein JWN24_3101 [Phycisphaerales bacterium]|nr:hypothetical protein [Phycisphaerales bacterium]